ncbi:MAG: PilZ domain-containing protein [Planctomycetes bacterium]|nr:PilZ domain-containing protein [Planctomycetota bacterium]
MLRFSPQGAKVQARRVATFMGLLGSKEDICGDVLDVSGVGLRFVTPQKVPLNARLKMTVSFASVPETFACTAVVRWSHPHAQGGKYVVGVEFENAGPDQLQILDKAQKTTKG